MGRPSLRRRLLALLLGLSALVWIGIGISAYVEIRHEARELFREHLPRGELRHAEEEIVEALGDALRWPLAAGLPVLALAIWLGVGAGLRPLRELRAQLARRGASDLAPLDGSRAVQEIEPLVAELNRLFARIDQALQRERRLTADAAHELRTPLTVLSTHAQVARGAGDEASRNEALDALVAGAERAARLIEQMLTLARLEAGQLGDEARPVALGPLARTVLAGCAPAAVAKGIDLSLEGAEDAEVRAHPALLAILLRNLVENAVRYTPARGAVRVLLEADSSKAVLTVADDGPGVPPAELARLGERFHRLAPPGESGSGLGLSIVLRIAELHRGRVRFSNAPAGGLVATVELPR